VRLVYADRGHGKTVAAVEAVVRTNGFLLVGTYKERDRILKQFRKKDYRGYDTYIRPHQVITVYDLHTGRFRGTMHMDRMVIDNLELVIEQLVGMAVDVVTTSVHPETVIMHNKRLEEENQHSKEELALPAPVVEVAGSPTVGEVIEKKRLEIEAGGFLANDDRTQL
jgi:hypothetical protein